MISSRTIMCTLAALSLGVGGVAFGQQSKDVQRDSPRPVYDTPRGGGHDNGNRGNRGDDRGHRGDNRGNNGWHGGDHRGPDRRPDYRVDNRRDGRGAGPNHNYYRGGRLPPEYRSRQYVVDDWRGHRLSAPPRGYHWVQTGGDYVLVAITTGIIASILLSQ